MTPQTYAFECNSGTYMDCIEQSVFASNKPWPLEIKDGEYCLLHHYEIGGLLGIWQAVGNGGRNLVPGLWKNKFPFQVRVKLLLPKPAEVPRKLLAEHGINPAMGRFDHCVDEDLAEEIIRAMLNTAS